MCRTAVLYAMTFFIKSRLRLLKTVPALMTLQIAVIMKPLALLWEKVKMELWNSYFQVAVVIAAVVIRVILVVVVGVVVATVAVVAIVKKWLKDNLMMWQGERKPLTRPVKWACYWKSQWFRKQNQ